MSHVVFRNAGRYVYGGLTRRPIVGRRGQVDRGLARLNSLNG
jgi:hypothetical protein